MSSVESIFPMFGVSEVVFHGSGFPYIGMPLTIAFGGAPTGAKMMTSYFDFRFSSFATSCVLM